ncbi:hypothetical protein ACPJXG_20140 [Janthinobacterium sp. NFX145]|uniref:hypothetical protein n=1 Tax=Janthinobacterium sp. NFX145 TaxID=3415602 RepID=UPI003CC63130
MFHAAFISLLDISANNVGGTMPGRQYHRWRLYKFFDLFLYRHSHIGSDGIAMVMHQFVFGGI